MRYFAFRVYVLAAIAAAAAGCGDKNNPSQPSDTSSSLTASVTAPRAVSPASDAVVRNGDQPVTLVVQNAVTTQPGSATTYSFEVATDAGFAAKVQIKDGIAAGSGGQTALRLDMLTPARDYYWRARATSGGTNGVFGAATHFSIGPAIQIDPPVPVSPANGATSNGWPAFTVINSTRSGGAGSIVYRFEIATNASFNPLLVTGTVGEQSNRTTFVPPRSPAPAAQTPLFWRAFAIDQSNNVQSPASAALNFTYATPTVQSELAAQQGLTLWPGAQPTGTNGQARLGPNWDVATIVSFDGVRHTKPTIEQLRVFDLIDRGMDPQSALNWMNGNGYATVAVYYPSVQVIGFPFEYMALVAGSWELVIRVGA